ncbi:purine-binding chemotaxis protein CheW [Marinitoga hydrogenitolerans DSM 16785]|uniref:Purine-binding chemotaxis protein CheW n=1 Tax=Marinitoga hydrogenitolerans (strain DSM 16785 / JCM 12826 / AT1271) TaxID=1122195 RepID=A0A1M4X5T6_MARH1|nr:chemotaxis protein CheW [Marinitoga hydrogenitolerans]SHE88805.1 purine-binding chemotaxis protein CheW [Marinitoga hydrogenitolerans DSM 16785]
MQKEILSFEILNQEFGIDVEYVEMVIEKEDITPVPNSKDFIEGIVNLRGRIVTVFDLTKILDLEIDENFEFDSIIIMKHEKEELGILVNKVNNVISFDDEELDILPSKSGTFVGKVNGVLKIDNRLIVYLNLDKLFESIEI